MEQMQLRPADLLELQRGIERLERRGWDEAWIEEYLRLDDGCLQLAQTPLDSRPGAGWISSDAYRRVLELASSGVRFEDTPLGRHDAARVEAFYVFDDDAVVARWMDQPNAGLEGETPRSAATTSPEGLQRVLDVLHELGREKGLYER